MRSIFFSSRFHSKIIKFFSVTPSAYQSPYSTLKQGVTNLVQFQSSLLNTNARMYLYDTPRDKWPRIRCSRAYSQHQHGRLQGLCPTLPIIFSCVPELLTQHKCKHSCVQSFLLNKKY